MSKIELRPIERKGFCRGCDKMLYIGSYIVYTYSHRNRGQSIFFCVECAKQIGKLVEDK
jgi:RNase P subunit RPR2